MTPTLLACLLVTCLSFLSGSLPFSLWVGKWFTGGDIRSTGDHNPGATNALKAGGWKAGILSLILDVSKGAAPVGFAYVVLGWHGWEIIPIALAPVFGHAYSPFLNFKGGKALAVSLGIWIGLLLWKAPVIILIPLTISFLLVDNSGIAVIASLLTLGGYLYFVEGNPIFLIVYAIQFILLVWKHRSDFHKPIKFRVQRNK